MAEGFRRPLYEYAKTPNLSSSFPDDLTIPLGFYGLIEGPTKRAGTLANELPISENVRNLTGYKQFTFFDDYYNRIYLIPPSINFGSVTDDIEQSLIVWNAYTRPNTLVSVTPHNATGVSILGMTIPSNFESMQYRTYTVHATSEGPAYIDATFEFKFEAVDVASVLSVFGSRAELWRLPPNWSDRYVIEYEYKTDIFTSRSGKEQRRALRKTPRKNVQFQAVAYADDMRWFNRTMAGWQRNSFLLPEVTRNVVTTTPMPPGVAQVELDAVPYWIVQGASVVLAQAGQSAARLVESVNNNTVVFTSVGTESWQPGAKVYPGLSGRIQPEISTRRLTSEVGTIGVAFNQTPASEVYPVPPAPEVTYRNTEVVMIKPNYAQPIQIAHRWPVETVDYGRGQIATFVPVDFSTRNWQAQYLRINRQQAQELVDVFHRANGRRGEFYMPTWENDLPPLDQISIGAFRLRVKGTDVYRLLKNDPVFRNVAVFTIDGQVLFNQVAAMETVNDERGEDSILTLTTPWDVAVEREAILRICWLVRWRFASDALSVSWITDEVATITPTMQMLEDQP